MLQAFKLTETMGKIIYTSSFFALGATDGYVADESQVRSFHFVFSFSCFPIMKFLCLVVAGSFRELFLYRVRKVEGYR